MATEVVKYASPAIQRRKDGDPDENIDLKFVHQFIPWTVLNVAYKLGGGFVGPVTLNIMKVLPSGEEVTVKSQAGIVSDFFFNEDVEMSHGDAIRVFTAGVVLAAAQYHEVTVNWDERRT